MHGNGTAVFSGWGEPMGPIALTLFEAFLLDLDEVRFVVQRRMCLMGEIMEADGLNV